MLAAAHPGGMAPDLETVQPELPVRRGGADDDSSSSDSDSSDDSDGEGQHDRQAALAKHDPFARQRGLDAVVTAPMLRSSLLRVVMLANQGRRANTGPRSQGFGLWTLVREVTLLAAALRRVRVRLTMRSMGSVPAFAMLPEAKRAAMSAVVRHGTLEPNETGEHRV